MPHVPGCIIIYVLNVVWHLSLSGLCDLRAKLRRRRVAPSFPFVATSPPSSWHLTRTVPSFLSYITSITSHHHHVLWASLPPSPSPKCASLLSVCNRQPSLRSAHLIVSRCSSTTFQSQCVRQTLLYHPARKPHWQLPSSKPSHRVCQCEVTLPSHDSASTIIAYHRRLHFTVPLPNQERYTDTQ